MEAHVTLVTPVFGVRPAPFATPFCYFAEFVSNTVEANIWQHIHLRENLRRGSCLEQCSHNVPPERKSLHIKNLRVSITLLQCLT